MSSEEQQAALANHLEQQEEKEERMDELITIDDIRTQWLRDNKSEIFMPWAKSAFDLVEVYDSKMGMRAEVHQDRTFTFIPQEKNHEKIEVAPADEANITSMAGGESYFKYKAKTLEDGTSTLKYLLRRKQSHLDGGHLLLMLDTIGTFTMFSFLEEYPDAFSTTSISLDFYDHLAQVDQSSYVDFYFCRRNMNKFGSNFRMVVMCNGSKLAEASMQNVFMYKPKKARM
uniref:Uncharacterized protein n=1 Tax=Strombidium inclinatum TaxID=197538 RepID=A0A7S3N0Z1_9SPIT|mmetsp:Transcript_7956/g.12303  ORF Transcript_7956/g.12303 Transcript_7956/m.12303 type:complete len:229 (+) Transcript_7956:67-753(+)